MVRGAYSKDIWRTIGRSRKRFFSLLLITALGVTVFTGIYAACNDMFYSADQFYDEQNLFDIRVISTLGLTDEDVEAVQMLPEIETAEGAYSEKVNTEDEGVQYTAELTTLSKKGINMPHITAGVIPQKSGEIAVTGKYLSETGKKLGDSVTIEEEFEEETETGTLASEESGEDEEDADVDWDTDVEIEEEIESPSFKNTTYTITAEVLDPMDINNNGIAFRSSSGTTDYTFYITAEDVNEEIYSYLYITLTGMEALDCYKDEYNSQTAAVIKRIETEIKEQREEARYNAIIEEAKSKISDAETTMHEKFTEAEGKFADAWQDIEKARTDLVEGETELAEQEEEAKQKIADARTRIENQKKQLADSETQLQQGEAELKKGKKELEDNQKELEKGKKKFEKEQKNADQEFAAAEQQFSEKQAALDSSRATALNGINELKSVFGDQWPEDKWNALISAAAAKTAEQLSANSGAEPDMAAVAAATSEAQVVLSEKIMAVLGESLGTEQAGAIAGNCIQAALGLGVIEGSQQVLDAGKTSYQTEKTKALKQMEKAKKELEDGENKLKDGQKLLAEKEQELNDGKAKIADGWQQLKNGEEELNSEEEKAQAEITKAWDELADGKQELTEGESELIRNEEKYQEKKVEAEQKVADAYDELADIDMTEWYIQDRTSLDSYSSLKTDMTSIETIGNAVPIVFLIVAILISLTTMTRMIEEERGLIGTYKALGFSDVAICGKYLVYAAMACILGGVLGDLLGFIVLPKILVTILLELYSLPKVHLIFDTFYGISGILLFLVGIVGAAFLSCRGELLRMPAKLMRPKAPRNGSRVFLERIPFIWHRLKFLNKVTVRNLFRYKKRFFMTVLGIMGCTSLVVAGFGIKNTVTIMMPKQYEDIYKYDLMAVTTAEDNEAFIQQIEKESEVSDYLNLKISNAKVFHTTDHSESVQLMVIPDTDDLNSYIATTDKKGRPVEIDDSGIFITVNAAELLDIQTGDTVTIQNLQLEEGTAEVSGIINNYLGNNVFIRQSLYETMFEGYEPNGILAHLSPECADRTAYAESLLDNDIVLSSVSSEALKEDLMSNFALMNAVVTLIIVLAAGLAFIVLFTLSNTNISERNRELATTKVLGFYDNEVHSYVNKETLILTGIGVLLGLPVGWLLSDLLTSALKMPALYFVTYVEPVSYIYAAVISFSFALIVNFMTNRVLNKINMVEALKSVE